MTMLHMLKHQLETYDSRNQVLWLSAVMLLAVAVRILEAVLKTGYIGHDYAVYLMLGKNLALGHGFTLNGLPHLHHPPLLSMMIAVVYLITNNLLLSGAVIGIIFSALALIPIYLIALQAYGPRVALTCMLLCSVVPALSSSFWLWGSVSEPAFIFFAFLGIYFSIKAFHEYKIIWYVLLAITFALAYLIRAEGIIYFALLMLVIMLAKLKHRRFSRKDFLEIIVSLFVFSICIFPYISYLHQHTGKWMISGKTSITYILYPLASSDPIAYEKKAYSLNKNGTSLLIDSYRTKSIFSEIKKNPRQFITRFTRNIKPLFKDLISMGLFPWFLIPFMLIGLLWSLGIAHLRNKALLLSLCMLPAVSYLFFHIEARFIVIIIPILVVWSALGIEVVRDGIRPLNIKNIYITSLSASILPILLAALMYFTVFQVLSNAETPEHERLRHWLQTNIPSGSVIISREPELAVYADADWAGTVPYASFKRFMKYARFRKTNYVAVNKDFLEELRPQLSSLLDSRIQQSKIRIVYRDNADNSTIVFRIDN